MIYIPYDKDNLEKDVWLPKGYTSGTTDCPDCHKDCYAEFHSGYTIGYNEGYAEGYDDGQGDCPECSGGTDCSSAVTRAYNSGYTNGYAAGQADCPVCPPCPPCPSGDCSSAITEAYQSGITAGEAQQKAKLVSTAITQNGTYNRADGWSSVTVNVTGTSAELIEGWYDLEADFSGYVELTPQDIYPQSTADGFSKITIADKDYGGVKYNDGYTAGVAEQKAKLSSTAITQNGTYTRADGWSSVTVNVQSSVGKGVDGYVVSPVNTVLIDVINELECVGEWQYWNVDVNGSPAPLGWSTPINAGETYRVSINAGRSDTIALNPSIWTSIKI